MKYAFAIFVNCMKRFFGKKSHKVYLLVQIAFETNLHSTLSSFMRKVRFGFSSFSSIRDTSDCATLGFRPAYLGGSNVLFASSSISFASSYLDGDVAPSTPPSGLME